MHRLFIARMIAHHIIISTLAPELADHVHINHAAKFRNRGTIEN